MLIWRDILGRCLAALVLACAWLCLPTHAVAESAADSANPFGVHRFSVPRDGMLGARWHNTDGHGLARTHTDGAPDFAETATFLPVGTGVSSARVGALAVRTGAGLGADVGWVVLAPPNEVQPRSYRIEHAAHCADSAQLTAAPVTGPPGGASLAYDNFVIAAACAGKTRSTDVTIERECEWTAVYAYDAADCGTLAPDNVTPGTTRIDHMKYNEKTKKLEESRVIYDEHGRQKFRVDKTDHGRPEGNGHSNDPGHSNPHLHESTYAPQGTHGYNDKTGRKEVQYNLE